MDNTTRLGELPAGAVKPFPVVAGGTGIGVIEAQGGSSSPVGTTVAISGGRYGISADGTWAEHRNRPQAAGRRPDQVDDMAAAALSTGAGYSTSYLAPHRSRRLPARPGQTVLAPGVDGAAGQGEVQTRESVRDGVTRLTGGNDAVLDGIGGALTGEMLGAHGRRRAGQVSTTASTPISTPSQLSTRPESRESADMSTSAATRFTTYRTVITDAPKS